MMSYLKVAVCTLVVALALGLSMGAVRSFTPRCETAPRVGNLVPQERTCSSNPEGGLLFGLAGILVVTAALRVVSSPEAGKVEQQLTRPT
jgi:hypothetical protein